jgi:hypothetical protein
MLGKFMTALGLSSGSSDSSDQSARRSYPRRLHDKCVSVIDGLSLPVLDWSPGGLRVFADTRTVTVGKEVDVVLKFQIQNEMINIRHRAHIVRKTRDNFALQFLPLPAEIRTAFTQIIDSFNANEFAASQA